MSSPYQVGDRVVFRPDEQTIATYGRAFPRLGIYPGYVGPVVRTTGDLVRVGDTLKAFPSSQFERADGHAASVAKALRASYERRYYADRGPNPYRMGQRLRFAASDLCELWHGDTYRAAGMYPHCTGAVTAVRDDGYVEIDHYGVFFHWSEFTPAERAVGNSETPSS